MPVRRRKKTQKTSATQAKTSTPSDPVVKTEKSTSKKENTARLSLEEAQHIFSHPSHHLSQMIKDEAPSLLNHDSSHHKLAGLIAATGCLPRQLLEYRFFELHEQGNWVLYSVSPEQKKLKLNPLVDGTLILQTLAQLKQDKSIKPLDDNWDAQLWDSVSAILVGFFNIQVDDAQSWYQKGLTLASLEGYEDAIFCYEKALNLNPDNYQIWEKRGIALEHLEHLEEALQSFNQAIDLNPNDDKTWYNKGMALVHSQRYKEAIFCYEKALNLNPNNYKTWYERGIALYHLEELEEALQSFNQAIDLNSDDSETCLNHGIALYNLGQLEEALNFFNQVIEVNPNHSKTLIYRGKILHDLGRLEDALDSYEKVVLDSDFLSKLEELEVN